MNKLKIFIVVLLLGVTGCEDYLDKAPELGLTEDEVFLEFESARGFFDDTYNKLVDIHSWDSQNIRNNPIGGLSDEMATVVTSNEQNSILTLNSGKWLNQPSLGEVGWNENSDENRSTVIGSAFACLRIANKVIANAGQIPNATAEEINGLLGQAYFMRAWWYFQIIQRWGGMPIFDKAYAPTDDMDLPRVTYQESSEWLISDLDKAIELLPHRWSDLEYGRATKGAAYGLRSMAALYAASPLMNNGLLMIQNNGYSIPWCERAAAYAHEAITYVQNGTGGHNYRLMTGAEYKNIFYHEGVYASDESLWFKMDGNRRSNRDLQNYTPKRIQLAGGNGASAITFANPTQNMVDMFETLSGYPISDPAATDYDPQNPYANRDPRLANNIIVPGEEWGVNADNDPLYLETYVGGRDFNQLLNTTVSSARMPSGYACKKFIWPEANGYSAQWGKNQLNTVYIRTSQLYLDYAEAMNQAYGPTADPKGYGLTAEEAINVIRDRVGMPAVVGKFTTTKEAFRERIRNERGVELMFENHRWHDLRRWMIAEEVFKQPITGMRANPPKGHGKVKNKSTLDFTYQVIALTVEQRVFTTRQYWYPVAQNHVENLYNFHQNPGW